MCASKLQRQKKIQLDEKSIEIKIQSHGYLAVFCFRKWIFQTWKNNKHEKLPAKKTK